MRRMTDSEAPDDLLNERQAAALATLSPATMRAYRYRGAGPTWFKLGPRAVRYRRGDILSWVAEQATRSASPAA